MLGRILRELLRLGAGRRARERPRPSGPPAARAGWLEEALRLQQASRTAELVALCRSRLEHEPDSIEALEMLAAALCARGRAREAIAPLRRVTELAPESADAHASLGGVLAGVGDPESAIESYRRCLRLRPDRAADWSRLAALLKALGRYDEAEECCRSGLAADARHAGLHHTLAGALFEQGRVEEAIAAARESLALQPDAPSVHSDFVRMLNYADGRDPAAIYGEHRAWAERHAEPLRAAAAPHGNDPDPARRLRVGFVSPWFCKHAMTFFFESVVEHHDGERMEIILYADVAEPDEYSERLKSYGAAWRNTLGRSDEQLAAIVRRDLTDILVDLSGHTPRHRLLAFARRPAPVQVTWNGYPNTTGMTAMDFRITDAHCDPPGATEHLHSEELVRLPQVYMSWRPPPDAPDPGPLPALRSGRVTFGSFNSCFKVTPSLAALWARVLHAVPGARLMLLTVSSRGAERRLRELFAAQGIGPDRIELLPRVSHEEFLAAHRRADIALDTFPYHGTTTTCFSLWMGLPVVVLEGAAHASRVGVSLLANVGLPQLVARTADEYVAIAARLAADLPALAALREGLRERVRTSPLADGPGGARALEDALRQMWSGWCARQGPGNPRRSGPATDTRHVVIQTDYGPMIFPRGDSMIRANVIVDGAWEKDEIELLRWFMNACYGSEQEVEILDIGAYNGIYAIALARFAFPKVTVHAFEAQREIFELLTATVALNRLDNVRCHHKAVSSEGGAVIRFRPVDYSAPANFGSVEIEPVARPDFDGHRLEEATESVETVRIDDLGFRRVRLMKIDVEGMEHKVLAGAADTIRRCRPLIFLEYEKTDFAAVKAFLREAGYRSYYAQRPNILCVPADFTHIAIDGARPVEY